jgi:GNAT superfamily N-acetyltransferase
MDTTIIRNPVPADTQALYELNCLVYDVAPGTPINGVLPPEGLLRHIEQFPEGIFIAETDGLMIGFAITMRTNRSPEEPALKWLDAIGGDFVTAHDPTGRWLYGVEFGVHPDYRKHGIGTRLYRTRFEFVKRLGLAGFYAGGMLQGYKDYYRQMTLQEYGRKVRAGEIIDPTLSMQIKRGFRPGQVIEDYCGIGIEENAMLIVWQDQAAGNLLA